MLEALAHLMVRGDCSDEPLRDYNTTLMALASPDLRDYSPTNPGPLTVKRKVAALG